MEHILKDIKSPLQYLPPYLGAGSLQDLCLICTPPPQDLEHWAQCDQGPHSPFTAPGREPL